MISAALAWVIGRSGAQGINAKRPDIIRLGLFFG
jgi:hypothetical protein